METKKRFKFEVMCQFPMSKMRLNENSGFPQAWGDEAII